MIKNFLIALFGFVFAIFVEGFSRIIISFFHKVNFQFFGIDALPGISWIITIYFVSVIATWLGAMLAMSMSGDNAEITFRNLIGIFILWLVFGVLVTYKTIPIWYVLSFPIMTILGLVFAQYTFKLNQHAISDR